MEFQPALRYYFCLVFQNDFSCSAFTVCRVFAVLSFDPTDDRPLGALPSTHMYETAVKSVLLTTEDGKYSAIRLAAMETLFALLKRPEPKGTFELHTLYPALDFQKRCVFNQQLLNRVQCACVSNFLARMLNNVMRMKTSSKITKFKIVFCTPSLISWPDQSLKPTQNSPQTKHITYICPCACTMCDTKSYPRERFSRFLCSFRLHLCQLFVAVELMKSIAPTLISKHVRSIIDSDSNPHVQRIAYQCRDVLRDAGVF